MYKNTIGFRVVLELTGFALLGILACNHEKTPQTSSQQPTTTENVDTRTYQFKTFEFDTTTNTELPTPKVIERWSEADDYFPVFRLSKDCYGIAFDMEEIGLPTLLDSLFYKRQKEESVVIDSTGPFILYQSKSQQKAVFANDTTRYLYICGTKGATMGRISGVLYNEDECSAVLVLTLAPLDTNAIGEPLIAAKKQWDLTYATVDSFQRDLETYSRYLRDHADYSDKIIARQFAYNDQFFLTYDDDFQWYQGRDTICYFPTRTLFKRNGRSLKRFWAGGLDLFGISCD